MGPIRADAADITERPLRLVTDGHTCVSVTVVFPVDMHPHDELFSGRVVYDFRSFDNPADMQIACCVRGIWRQGQTFIFPVFEIRAGIAGDATCIHPVILPILTGYKTGGAFFYLTVEIINTAVVHDACAVCVDGVSVCVEPWEEGGIELLRRSIAT